MSKIAKPVNKPYYVFNGFHAGLKPKEIIQLKRYNGRDYFLVKWGRTEDPTYLEAEVAKKKCPLLVCLFFQNHTYFKGDKIYFKGNCSCT